MCPVSRGHDTDALPRYSHAFPTLVAKPISFIADMSKDTPLIGGKSSRKRLRLSTPSGRRSLLCADGVHGGVGEEGRTQNHNGYSPYGETRYRDGEAIFGSARRSPSAIDDGPIWLVSPRRRSPQPLPDFLHSSATRGRSHYVSPERASTRPEQRGLIPTPSPIRAVFPDCTQDPGPSLVRNNARQRPALQSPKWSVTAARNDPSPHSTKPTISSSHRIKTPFQPKDLFSYQSTSRDIPTPESSSTASILSRRQSAFSASTRSTLFVESPPTPVSRSAL